MPSTLGCYLPQLTMGLALSSYIRLVASQKGLINFLLVSRDPLSGRNIIVSRMRCKDKKIFLIYNYLFSMQVHCGFIQNGGADMDAVDSEYVKKCKYVVASGIFDGYDTPHQPSNISARSKNLFCFLMVVDEKTLSYIRKTGKIMEDSSGGRWVGVWRLILLRNPPYDEPRRNGKVPKILTHRLFPDAQYSIWIDGKMELIVDPLLILER
jgi:hypothetical protein